MSFMVLNTGRVASQYFYINLSLQPNIIMPSRYEFDYVAKSFIKRRYSIPLKNLAQYKENQIRNPLSQYGSSKALGEELIETKINDIEKATILRTSWVISPIGKNFILTMLRLHSEKETIKNDEEWYGADEQVEEEE